MIASVQRGSSSPCLGTACKCNDPKSKIPEYFEYEKSERKRVQQHKSYLCRSQGAERTKINRKSREGWSEAAARQAKEPITVRMRAAKRKQVCCSRGGGDENNRRAS
ncbi:uncharacterized [Tachysurus ichikawai]